LRSLWKVPAKGGEAESMGIEMEKLREPTISPDGSRIAFTGGDTKEEVWALEGLNVADVAEREEEAAAVK
jgi:Tol biopolymer transport system component